MTLLDQLFSNPDAACCINTGAEEIDEIALRAWPWCTFNEENLVCTAAQRDGVRESCDAGSSDRDVIELHGRTVGIFSENHLQEMLPLSCDALPSEAADA